MARTRNDPVRVGAVTERLTTTGRVSGFQIEVWHDGLGEHRVLSDRDVGVLENKLAAHLSRWEEKYQKRLEKEALQARRDAGAVAAEKATAKAEESLQACRDILRRTLSVDDRLDWESLKVRTPMILKRKRTAGITYADNGRPEAIRAAKRPRRPKRPRGASPVYEEPQFNVVERLLPFLRQRKKERHTRRFAEQQARFEEALAEYEEALREWTRKSREADRVEAQRRSTLANEQKEWANKEKEHKRKQRAMNAEVNALRRAYANWDEADGRPVEEHARLVLKASSYPDWITIDFELGFNPDARTLMVEYRLPQRESMPTLRSVAYVQSRDDLKESHIPAREQDSLYENICYQIALRTIHELYEADEIKAFDAVVFNGWRACRRVRGTNPATGKRSKSCIMSVQAMRREFLALNLKEIDPKACFRSLKGVSAAKLATFTPVQPILRLDTGDRRFVESRDIAGDLSDESNLAAMDWETALASSTWSASSLNRSSSRTVVRSR